MPPLTLAPLVHFASIALGARVATRGAPRRLADLPGRAAVVDVRAAPDDARDAARARLAPARHTGSAVSPDVAAVLPAACHAQAGAGRGGTRPGGRGRGSAPAGRGPAVARLLVGLPADAAPFSSRAAHQLLRARAPYLRVAAVDAAREPRHVAGVGGRAAEPRRVDHVARCGRGACRFLCASVPRCPAAGGIHGARRVRDADCRRQRCGLRGRGRSRPGGTRFPSRAATTSSAIGRRR
jgi:hypothetical protein